MALAPPRPVVFGNRKLVPLNTESGGEADSTLFHIGWVAGTRAAVQF